MFWTSFSLLRLRSVTASLPVRVFCEYRRLVAGSEGRLWGCGRGRAVERRATEETAIPQAARTRATAVVIVKTLIALIWAYPLVSWSRLGARVSVLSRYRATCFPISITWLGGRLKYWTALDAFRCIAPYRADRALSTPRLLLMIVSRPTK